MDARFDLVAEISPSRPCPIRLAARQSPISVAWSPLRDATSHCRGVHNDDASPSTLPPWPLQRAEIEAFAAGGLTQVRIKIVATSGDPAERRWRAEFYRPLKMRVLSDQQT